MDNYHHVELDGNIIPLYQEYQPPSDYYLQNLDSTSLQKPKDEPKSILINASYAGQKTYLTVEIEQSADHNQIPTYESVISAVSELWEIPKNEILIYDEKDFWIRPENFAHYFSCIYRHECSFLSISRNLSAVQESTSKEIDTFAEQGPNFNIFDNKQGMYY